MSKDGIVISLGVWVVILPQLGFPKEFFPVILTITGLLLIVVGIVIRRNKGSKKVVRAHAYAEHNPADVVASPVAAAVDTRDHERIQ
jgi:hypothetical protein